MSNIVKATIGFIYEPIDVMKNRALGIGVRVKKHETLYPSLKPNADEGILIINELANAISSDNGSPLSQALIKKKAEDVRNLIRKWGPQVTNDSNGILQILLTSGFDNRKKQEWKPDVTTPDKVKVKDTENSGIITVRVPAMKQADKYQYRYTTVINPEEKDYIYLDTGSRLKTIKDLNPGTEYYFSGRAFGTRSVSDWNNPVKWIVR